MRAITTSRPFPRSAPGSNAWRPSRATSRWIGSPRTSWRRSERANGGAARPQLNKPRFSGQKETGPAVNFLSRRRRDAKKSRVNWHFLMGLLPKNQLRKHLGSRLKMRAARREWLFLAGPSQGQAQYAHHHSTSHSGERRGGLCHELERLSPLLPRRPPVAYGALSSSN